PPDHLGDLVLTPPILHAIKQHEPGAHITMMVGPWSSEIVARHPAIDRLVVVPFPGFQRATQKALAPYILLLSVAKQLRRRERRVRIPAAQQPGELHPGERLQVVGQSEKYDQARPYDLAIHRRPDYARGAA